MTETSIHAMRQAPAPTDLSPRNQLHLKMLQDIYEVSESCGTRTYIWGGFVLDIVAGAIRREHGDLDGFTLNLLEVAEPMAAAFAERGYEATFRDDFQMLQIRMGEVHSGFNGLEIDGDVAIWRHIGQEGAVYFPSHWLDAAPRSLYGVQAYTAGIRFEYAIKTQVQLLSPEWKAREKDRLAIAELEELLSRDGMGASEIYRWVWSYNPFWYKRGYQDYFRPMLAQPMPTQRAEPGEQQ